jgi:hypothetical protein
MPLRRFNTDDIARLNRIYENAGRRIRSILRKFDPANFTTQSAARARAEIAEAVALLNRMSMEWSERAIPKAYRRGESTAKTTMAVLGLKPVKRRKFDARKKLVDDLAVTLIRANNSIITTSNRYLAVMALAAEKAAAVHITEYDYSVDAKAKIDRWATQAVANEDSRKSLVSKIKDYLRRFIDDDELIEVNGRLYNLKSYSEMLSRTTMRDAQTAATLDVCAEYDNDLVQFSDHQTECDVCKEFEGKIYSISGKHPDYPKLEESPPIHPNCEHSLLPTSDIAIRSEKRWGLYQKGEK